MSAEGCGLLFYSEGAHCLAGQLSCVRLKETQHGANKSAPPTQASELAVHKRNSATDLQPTMSEEMAYGLDLRYSLRKLSGTLSSCTGI